jgi:hypothetical protein
MAYPPKPEPPPDWLPPKEASDFAPRDELQAAIRAGDVAITIRDLVQTYVDTNTPIPWEFTETEADFAHWLRQFVSDAEFSEDSQHIRFGAFKDGQRVEGPWLNYEIWRPHLLKYWSPPPTRVANERTCRKWLVLELKPDAPRKTKQVYMKAAKARYGISKHRFNEEIWPKAIVEAGVQDKVSKAGRRSKR